MNLPFRQVTGRVYRAHHPRWAFAPESGDGARRRGGRFNRAGLAALYTSMTPRTAWLEAQQALPFKAQPMTLVAYDVDCEAMLDLSQETVRTAADIPYKDLACGWEDMALRGLVPPTWPLADRLIAAGCAGVIAPSFAHAAGADDLNVVFWRWSRELPYRVRAIDDEGRLPKNDLSWR